MAVRGQLPIVEQCRVVVDNDWAGDPDGLVALAHHLLSASNRVTTVTSSFLNPVFGDLANTAGRGAVLAAELVALIGPLVSPTIHAGCESALASGNSDSAASAAIIAEARREDTLPLYVVCAGPLTNIAAALQRAPDIAALMSVVWVGGSIGSDTFEYNRDTDPAAADVVLARTDLALRQFPLETYRRCAYSVAELEQDLAGSGRVGAWLWNRFLELPLPEWIKLGGVWPLGDSPPVLVTALSEESCTYTTIARAPGSAEHRVYTDVDFRLLVGDMLARLRLHEARRP